MYRVYQVWADGRRVLVGCWDRRNDAVIDAANWNGLFSRGVVILV